MDQPTSQWYPSTTWKLRYCKYVVVIDSNYNDDIAQFVIQLDDHYYILTYTYYRLAVRRGWEYHAWWNWIVFKKVLALKKV